MDRQECVLCKNSARRLASYGDNPFKDKQAAINHARIHWNHFKTLNDRVSEKEIFDICFQTPHLEQAVDVSPMGISRQLGGRGGGASSFVGGNGNQSASGGPFVGALQQLGGGGAHGGGGGGGSQFGAIGGGGGSGHQGMHRPATFKCVKILPTPSTPSIPSTWTVSMVRAEICRILGEKIVKRIAVCSDYIFVKLGSTNQAERLYWYFVVGYYFLGCILTAEFQ